VKKTILVASLLAFGAGAVSVSAIDLKGSDTLKEFTLNVINAAVCPGATSIFYNGGGSGVGESAMSNLPITQSVAPMSRFLQVGGATPNLAEGVAFAQDVVTVSVSKVHVACDANAASGVGCAVQPGGLRRSGTLNGGAYTLGTAAIAGWRDVLRLVYFGLDNTTGANPSAAGVTPVRNCSSAARADLVNNYGNLFEDAACGTGGCTQLTHAWRRDNILNLTDVFRELVLAKSYPFCNNRYNVDSTASVTYPTVLSTGAALFDDTYQDFDPIRRACVGGSSGQGAFLPAPTDNATVQPPFPLAPAEQVCGPKGTLGLVLPIRAPVGNPGDITLADAFPTKPCLRGSFNLGPAPKVPGSATRDTLCPNGDVPVGSKASDYNPTTGQVVGSSGICLIPAAADGDSQCINGRNNLPAVIDPPNPALVATDGRVYNLHMYGPGSTPSYKVDVEVGKTVISAANRQITGAFGRIHSTRTLIAAGPTCPGTAGSGRCCDKLVSTDLIGCLVEADPCSIGFSASSAPDQTLVTSSTTEAAFAASLAGIANRQECLQVPSYPLSRKLFINSIPGFENATAAEIALAVCFSGNVAGGPSQFAGVLAASGLFPIASGPACQTFVAGSGACAGNPAGIAP